MIEFTRECLRNVVIRTETFLKPFRPERWLLAFGVRAAKPPSDATLSSSLDPLQAMSLSHSRVSEQRWCEGVLRCSSPSQPCLTGYTTLGKTLHFCTTVASSVKWEYKSSSLMGSWEVNKSACPECSERCPVLSENRLMVAVYSVIYTWGGPSRSFPDSDCTCLSPALTKLSSLPPLLSNQEARSPLFSSRWNLPRQCSFTDSPKARWF